jgi:hypothetical protein
LVLLTSSRLARLSEMATHTISFESFTPSLFFVTPSLPLFSPHLSQFVVAHPPNRPPFQYFNNRAQLRSSRTSRRHR